MPGRTCFFPNLSKHITFASAPLVLTPLVRNRPTPAPKPPSPWPPAAISVPGQRSLLLDVWVGRWDGGKHVRPLSLLRLSLLRFVDSKCHGNSAWTWEFHPLNWDYAWVKASEIQNLSTEIGRSSVKRCCNTRSNQPKQEAHLFDRWLTHLNNFPNSHLSHGGFYFVCVMQSIMWWICFC